MWPSARAEPIRAAAAVKKRPFILTIIPQVKTKLTRKKGTVRLLKGVFGLLSLRIKECPLNE
jgi:hypothetical protein